MEKNIQLMKSLSDSAPMHDDNKTTQIGKAKGKSFSFKIIDTEGEEQLVVQVPKGVKDGYDAVEVFKKDKKMVKSFISEAKKIKIDTKKLGSIKSADVQGSEISLTTKDARFWIEVSGDNFYFTNEVDEDEENTLYVEYSEYPWSFAALLMSYLMEAEK